MVLAMQDAQIVAAFLAAAGPVTDQPSERKGSTSCPWAPPTSNARPGGQPRSVRVRHPPGPEEVRPAARRSVARIRQKRSRHRDAALDVPPGKRRLSAIGIPGRTAGLRQERLGDVDQPLTDVAFGVCAHPGLQCTLDGRRERAAALVERSPFLRDDQSQNAPVDRIRLFPDGAAHLERAHDSVDSSAASASSAAPDRRPRWPHKRGSSSGPTVADESCPPARVPDPGRVAPRRSLAAADT